MRLSSLYHELHFYIDVGKIVLYSYSVDANSCFWFANYRHKLCVSNQPIHKTFYSLMCYIFIQSNFYVNPQHFHYTNVPRINMFDFSVCPSSLLSHNKSVLDSSCFSAFSSKLFFFKWWKCFSEWANLVLSHVFVSPLFLLPCYHLSVYRVQTIYKLMVQNFCWAWLWVKQNINLFIQSTFKYEPLSKNQLNLSRIEILVSFPIFDELILNKTRYEQFVFTANRVCNLRITFLKFRKC